MEDSSVWVHVPKTWIYREDGKIYLVSGGHSIGPVLDIDETRDGDNK